MKIFARDCLKPPVDITNTDGTIDHYSDRVRRERDEYWAGYAHAQAELLTAMRKHPQTYIDFIQRGCTAPTVPSYDEAIAKLRAKYDAIALNQNLPLTDKLLREIEMIVAQAGKAPLVSKP